MRWRNTVAGVRRRRPPLVPVRGTVVLAVIGAFIVDPSGLMTVDANDAIRVEGEREKKKKKKKDKRPGGVEWSGVE